MFNGAIGAAKPNTLMTEYALRLGAAVLRNRTRAAEQSAQIEAQLANKVKSEFIANMSHELRTPLNTIVGFSKLVSEHDRRQLTDQDIIDYSRLILDAAGHLLSVINDILDISKIQSGRYTLEPRDISLEEILGACVAANRPLAESAGLALEHQLPDTLPPVSGDAQKLKQVFTNLIGNAIRFTRPGGRVWLEARGLADGSTEVVVQDTGVGMDADEIRVALTPFGQVDGSPSRWREGTGLGLPIAKALVELHGGELEISSERHKGTEVTVTLPPPQLVALIQHRGAVFGSSAGQPRTSGQE